MGRPMLIMAFICMNVFSDSKNTPLNSSPFLSVMNLWACELLFLNKVHVS